MLAIFPDRSSRRSYALRYLLLLTIIFGAALAAEFVWPKGLHVVVRNSGTLWLRGVTLDVSDAEVVLGDVPPGESRAATVAPTSESHLELDLRIGDGKRRRLNAGGYFNHGSAGRFVVSINDGQIEGVSSHTY